MTSNTPRHLYDASHFPASVGPCTVTYRSPGSCITTTPGDLRGCRDNRALMQHATPPGSPRKPRVEPGVESCRRTFDFLEPSPSWHSSEVTTVSSSRIRIKSKRNRKITIKDCLSGLAVDADELDAAIITVSLLSCGPELYL